MTQQIGLAWPGLAHQRPADETLPYNGAAQSGSFRLTMLQCDVFLTCFGLAWTQKPPDLIATH